MSVFRILWLSIKDIFDELFSLVLINLLWVLISAPLVLLAIVLLSAGSTTMSAVVMLLAVLPMAPSNAGLYTVAQRVTEGRVISWRLFFEGFREYLLLSWQLYGLWMIGLLIIVTNLGFYSRMNSSIGSVLLVLFLYFLLVWFGLLIYIGPLMLLQTDKRIRVIARNAFLMVFGRPFFTLITLILMGLLGVALGVIVPFLPLLLSFALLAIWSFRVTTTLVADAEARRLARQEQAAATNTRPNTDKGRSGQIKPRD
ncbi:MAG: DUF624 domain-containing protein [Roseiflexaceae bacterium]